MSVDRLRLQVPLEVELSVSRAHAELGGALPNDRDAAGSSLAKLSWNALSAPSVRPLAPREVYDDISHAVNEPAEMNLHFKSLTAT